MKTLVLLFALIASNAAFASEFINDYPKGCLAAATDVIETYVNDYEVKYGVETWGTSPVAATKHNGQFYFVYSIGIKNKNYPDDQTFLGVLVPIYPSNDGTCKAGPVLYEYPN